MAVHLCFIKMVLREREQITALASARGGGGVDLDLLQFPFDSREVFK